jgi:hypothetical protein
VRKVKCDGRTHRNKQSTKGSFIDMSQAYRPSPMKASAATRRLRGFCRGASSGPPFDRSRLATGLGQMIG